MPSTAKSLAGELAQAVRGHWAVESNNWIRDVSFREDGIKTKAGNATKPKSRAWRLPWDFNGCLFVIALQQIQLRPYEPGCACVNFA